MPQEWRGPATLPEGYPKGASSVLGQPRKPQTHWRSTMNRTHKVKPGHIVVNVSTHGLFEAHAIAVESWEGVGREEMARVIAAAYEGQRVPSLTERPSYWLSWPTATLRVMCADLHGGR